MTDHASGVAAPTARRPTPAVWLLVLMLLIGVAALAYFAVLARSVVSGAVTLDGKPLTTGLVSFHPVGEGPIPNSSLDATGTFSLNTGGSRGIARGSYRVTIAANEPAGGEPAEGGNSPIRPLMTPARYADPETSNLRAEVGWGINRFQFEISSDPPDPDDSK